MDQKEEARLKNYYGSIEHAITLAGKFRRAAGVKNGTADPDATSPAAQAALYRYYKGNEAAARRTMRDCQDSFIGDYVALRRLGKQLGIKSDTPQDILWSRLTEDSDRFGPYRDLIKAARKAGVAVSLEDLEEYYQNSGGGRRSTRKFIDRLLHPTGEQMQLAFDF